MAFGLMWRRGSHLAWFLVDCPVGFLFVCLRLSGWPWFPRSTSVLESCFCTPCEGVSLAFFASLRRYKSLWPTAKGGVESWGVWQREELWEHWDSKDFG